MFENFANRKMKNANRVCTCLMSNQVYGTYDYHMGRSKDGKEGLRNVHRRN